MNPYVLLFRGRVIAVAGSPVPLIRRMNEMIKYRPFRYVKGLLRVEYQS